MLVAFNRIVEKFTDLRELFDVIFEEFGGETITDDEFISDDFVIEEGYNGIVYCQRCKMVRYEIAGISHLVGTSVNDCNVKYVETKFPKRRKLKIISGTFWTDGGKLCMANTFSGNANRVIIYSHGLIICGKFENEPMYEKFEYANFDHIHK